MCCSVLQCVAVCCYCRYDIPVDITHSYIRMPIHFALGMWISVRDTHMEFVTHIWNPSAYRLGASKLHSSTVNQKSINPPMKMNKAKTFCTEKKQK